jgi:hypothetical protein
MSRRVSKRIFLAVGVLAMTLAGAGPAASQWPPNQPAPKPPPQQAPKPPKAQGQPAPPPQDAALYREERFIVHLYRGFLGRQPSPAEVRTWSERMGGGASPGDLVRAFMDSDEYFIRQSYLSLLRREPDPEGMNTYARELRNGWSRARVVEALINSDEFHRLLGGGGGGRPPR